MTRNSQDDLLISQYLFMKYIDFLLERLNQEYSFLENEFSNLNLSTLPKINTQYIHEQKNLHCKSTIMYFNFLIKIQKMTSDFYKKNQTPLSLYSIESFHENIKKHEEKIIQIIDELFKY